MRAGTVGEFPSMLTFVKDAFRESLWIGPDHATIGRVKSRSKKANGHDYLYVA